VREPPLQRRARMGSVRARMEIGQKSSRMVEFARELQRTKCVGTSQIPLLAPSASCVCDTVVVINFHDDLDVSNKE
jgi:hypothetical protein